MIAGEASRATVPSPLGPLTLVAGPGGLRALRFGDDVDDLPAGSRRPAALAEAMDQLREYLAGGRRGFDLALDLRGGPLERRVWNELSHVPYGETITYARLARTVGRPDILRGVAAAVARTPAPIVIPCHRVVGADGGLTGYVGGLERKAALLALERAVAGGPGREAVERPTQLELL